MIWTIGLDTSDVARWHSLGRADSQNVQNFLSDSSKIVSLASLGLVRKIFAKNCLELLRKLSLPRPGTAHYWILFFRRYLYNYDFKSLEKFFKHTLVNEEIWSNKMHSIIKRHLEPPKFLSRKLVTGWEASRLVIDLRVNKVIFRFVRRSTKCQ